MKKFEENRQTELDYEDFLQSIKHRKQLIHEAALSDDILNNEYVRLTEIEASVRKILRDELPNQETKVWETEAMRFDKKCEALPIPSEQNAPQHGYQPIESNEGLCPPPRSE